MSNRQSAANESMTIVKFIHLPIKNEAESKKQNREIFDDKEVCEIRFAGSREKVVHAPAHEIFRTDRDQFTGAVNEITYAMAYNEQYQAFKMNASPAISGTPTSELPFLSAAKRLELKALNIHTAEALAALDGNNLKMLGMGGREMKNQAQSFLDSAREGATVSGMAARLAALEAQNEQLKARLTGGAPVADEAADEPIAAPEDPNASPFFAMGADDIKNWIQEATGERPKGNPSHATLVARADAVNADIKAKRDAAAA